VQYRNAVLAASLTITFAAGALASTTARAAGMGWCPKPGTVVTGIEGGIAYSWTALGPDPDDATLCRSVAGAREASTADRDNVRLRLFNWESLNGNVIYRPDSIERIRDGWRAVLSGERDEISYDSTHRTRIVSPPVVVSGHNTVTREGQGEMLIGGRPVTVVKLKTTFTATYYSDNSNAGILGNINWNLWYAPELHIFVKGQFTGNPGHYRTGGARPTPPDFEVTSVREP
jgi:hypothetical protein